MRQHFAKQHNQILFFDYGVANLTLLAQQPAGAMRKALIRVRPILGDYPRGAS